MCGWTWATHLSRDFNEGYPKLRISSHPNVMPVLGGCNSPPNLVVISQFMPLGSLYQVLHEGSGGNSGLIQFYTSAGIHFANDIAKGMSVRMFGSVQPNLFLIDS